MDSSKVVVKSVALFEAAKGVLLVLVGIGAVSLVHRDVRVIAAALVGRLHLNPAQGFAGSFVEAAARITDARLWLIASIGFLYAVFRFIESYGLWFEKVWAEWLAVVSGGLFVPLEIYEVAEKFTRVRVCALIVNLAVVCAMIGVLVKNRRIRLAKSTPPKPPAA
ncbi:MAG: hypothetical protein RIQ79_1669 [Verrucomicrobiota bacterium]